MAAALDPAGSSSPRHTWFSSIPSLELPRNIFHYVAAVSWVHQIPLVVLTTVTFLFEVVPLELQRRVVNDLVKDRRYSWIVLLCAVYAGAVLLQGAIKLGLNIYRGWVSEAAKRDLRRRVLASMELARMRTSGPEARGVGASMVVAEVEPIGGFVGSSISEPLLQAGVLASVLAYVIHLDPWMAVAALFLFVPQLGFVPLMQNGMNRRTDARVWVLRQLGVSVVSTTNDREAEPQPNDRRVNRVLQLNMGILKLKFTMNFLMNLCSHLQVVAALLIGGWLILTDQIEVGAVVAFISAMGRLTDPWGDLVNYFREFSFARVKYRLLAGVVNQLARGLPIIMDEELRRQGRRIGKAMDASGRA
jgi:ABC-type multidrug transport system fused ATPase/permease subunit